VTRRIGKDLQEATMLAKDRKAFRIWLMQPDASKEKRGIVEGEEEEEEDKY